MTTCSSLASQSSLQRFQLHPSRPNSKVLPDRDCHCSYDIGSLVAPCLVAHMWCIHFQWFNIRFKRTLNFSVEAKSRCTYTVSAPGRWARAVVCELERWAEPVIGLYSAFLTGYRDASTIQYTLVGNGSMLSILQGS